MDGPTFEKERIINEGNLKERSILYLSHFAYTETELNLPPLIANEKGLPRYVGPDVLLTADEVNALWDKINTDPNKKRYDELRKLYSNWVYYKERLAQIVINIHTKGAYLLYLIAPAMTYKILNEVATISIRTDKETKHKLAKHRLQMFFKDLEAYVVPNKDLLKELEATIYVMNCETEEAKCYLHNLRLLTKSRLPLVPFRDWLKNQEDILSKILAHVSNHIVAFTEAYQYEIEFFTYQHIDSPKPGNLKLKTYQETKYEHKESDLEDIINTDL